MTNINHTKYSDKNENNIYESKFWKTTSWKIRWWAIYDTYVTESYVDKNWNEINNITEIFLDKFNKIIWLKSNQVNSGKIIWKSSKNKVMNLWIWNIVKSIIEEQKYENIEEFIKEINIGYSFKLDKILLNKDDFEKKYLNFWQESY